MPAHWPEEQVKQHRLDIEWEPLVIEGEVAVLVQFQRCGDGEGVRALGQFSLDGVLNVLRLHSSPFLSLHLLHLLLSAQYLDVLGGEPDVLLGSRLQGGGGVGGVSEHDSVHLVPGVLLQRVQQAGDVEVGEVGEQCAVGNSDVCDKTNLININILKCQGTVAPKKTRKMCSEPNQQQTQKQQDEVF